MISILAVVQMPAGAVILVVGDGGAIGIAQVAVGIALTALLVAEMHRQTSRALTARLNEGFKPAGQSRRSARASRQMR